MTDFNPLKWKEIWEQLSEEYSWKQLSEKCSYENGLINRYHLTSILEDLYVENQELKSRVETLEKSQHTHSEMNND